MSKKLNNEAELLREALKVGAAYIKNRGAGEIEAHDSQNEKVEFVYKMPEADYNLTAIIGPYHHNGYKTGKSPHNLPVLFDLSVEGDLVLRVFKVKKQ